MNNAVDFSTAIKINKVKSDFMAPFFLTRRLKTHSRSINMVIQTIQIQSHIFRMNKSQKLLMVFASGSFVP